MTPDGKKHSYKMISVLSGTIEFTHEGRKKTLHVLGADATNLPDEYKNRSYSVFASIGSGENLTIPPTPAQIYAVSSALPEMMGFSDFITSPSQVFSDHGPPLIARKYDNTRLTPDELKAIGGTFTMLMASNAKKCVKVHLTLENSQKL